MNVYTRINGKLAKFEAETTSIEEAQLMVLDALADEPNFNSPVFAVPKEPSVIRFNTKERA